MAGRAVEDGVIVAWRVTYIPASREIRLEKYGVSERRFGVDVHVTTKFESRCKRPGQLFLFINNTEHIYALHIRFQT
jgi:hypothetical protein